MPRRRSWLDKINPVNWLKNLIPKPERRRGSRDYGPREEQQPINPDLPQFGARQSFGARQPFGPDTRRREQSDFRRTWDEEGGEGSFHRAYSFFNSIPVTYENESEKEEVWEAFVRYMTRQDSGYRYRDVGNPFWSAIGRRPENFDWDGWRAAVWNGRHRS